MATTEFTATEDPVDNQTLLDAYNAQPKAGISYEVTPEFKAELQAARTHQDWLNTPVEPTDYSTLSGKQNRTIRDSINFIVGEDLDLYSKPAVTKKDYYERGFLDQEGKITPKGVLAGDLVEKGVLDKNFTINNNGKFFIKEESEFFTQGNEEVTDYNSYFEADPSRYDKMLEWKKAKDLGLFNQDEDEEDKPFVDTVSDTAVGVWDFLGLAGKTFQSGMRLTGLVPSSSPIGVSEDDKEKEIKRLKQEDQTRMYGFSEGAVENAGYSYLKINALAQKGLNYLQEKAGVLTKEQTEAYNTFNDYQAASLKNFQNKTKTVTNLLEAAGVDAAADLLAESRKVFGEERSEAIQQEGEQPGAMAGDFTNVLMGPALKVVGATTSGGSKLLNSVVNSKRIKQVERIKDGLAKASLYETQANKLTLEAKLFSDEAANAALLEREAIAFGDTQRAILHTADKSKYAEDAAVASQQAGNNANMARSLRETANVLENSLPPTFQSQVAKAGMVAAAVPLKAAGAVVDKFGSTLAVVDRGISAITGTFGLDKARGLARAAGLFTGYINPLTIAEGVVASHKLWTGAGRLLNSLGENMLVNQGTNPFFRRVAADMATPVGRIFATSADTFIPPVVKGVSSIAKGVKTAAAPSLIYQAINQQGLDANVFKQAAADALVFGAPLGFGAAIIGKHSDFKSARQADRADFNNKMKADPAQYEIYNSMVDPLTKDVISSFVAAYPETQIKFVTEGPSFQQGNTATLNVNAPRDIIPVIALHELKHTLANQFQLNDLIKQKMVGDKTRPGDIFTKDGVLDPEFIAFGKEYNRRMKAGGMEELGIEDMAIEFYTDKAAEVLKSDIISGEFTGRAKESQLSRSIKAHFSTLVNQVPIIKNIHLKTGGAIDKSGKLVTGSGLVSGGLTQSPVVQAMVRKMYRETAGLTRQTKVSDGATISNTRIPQTKSNREGINNGTSAVENVNKQSREAGVEIPAGALDPSTPRGRDGVPTPLQTKAIVDSGAIHPEHLATFPTLVAEMVPDSSATFMFEYRPATQGRTAQSQAGETFHHVKPAGVRVNKKGNVLIIGLDINLWDKNIKKVANSKAAKDIGYSERDIRTDAYEASKFHIKNQSPDPYFEGKYGREQALKRKSLVASTYGEMTKSQNNFNPLLSEAGMSKADGVYRTFSLDDIKRVSRTNSTADLAFDPNNYYSLKINLMPEAPIVDRNGNIVENPVMKDFFENHLPNGQRFREKSMAPEVMDVNAQRSYMPEEPITSSSERWRSMSNKEKDAYVFAPAEMTPSNRAEFNARVKSGSLSADTPVVDINRSNLLTSKYGPPSSSATGNINTWIDDNTGKPVAVAFSEYGNIPTKGGWNPNPIKATNEVAKAKGIPNKITENIFNLLKDKPISVGMADLLGAGGKVRGISVTGGPGYPVQMFDPQNPSKITAVWASQEQGIRTILQNMEKTNSIWKDESGHHWAIYSPHTMKQSAHKSNAQTPLIYVSKINKMAERGALTKETAIEISNHIRKNVASAKDMPDIGSRKLEKFINDASFETRADIMNELTTTRSKEIGAPAPESVLTESRDVQYQGVERNALTSLLLIDIDRMAIRNSKGKWELRKDLKASDFGVEAHPSYDTIMPGRILAHFDNPVPFDVATPKMVSTMFKASPKSRPDYLLTKLPPDKGVTFQPLTKEVMEAINSVQDIKGNVPYIREVVKAGTGNWKRFSSKDSQAGLKEFTFAIERSPAKESLTQYDYKDVQKMIKRGELEVHQLGENDIWFGVKKTKSGNDLVSVVNNTGIPGMLNVIMARAIEAGVNTLDASSVITAKTPNGLLPTLYERYGWKETGRDKFDRKYLVERNKSDTKAQHEAKIAQKEAALKMFWEEQGWDGKTMPDIVYMKLEGKTNGKQTGPVINEYKESLASREIGSIGSTSKATSGEVRGSGLSQGQGQGSVGGTPTGATGADSGVLPRGFDSVVETIRSASDIQLKSMGLTVAEKKKFLDRFDK